MSDFDNYACCYLKTMRFYSSTEVFMDFLNRPQILIIWCEESNLLDEDRENGMELLDEWDFVRAIRIFFFPF